MKSLVAAALLVLPAILTAQENTTTVIMGRVTVRGGGPLPYASVTINGKNPQFTDSLGRFQVEGIAAGNVVLRAKRIGYSPVEQTARIQRGDTARVMLQLTRLAIQLPPVETVAHLCTNPGAPGRDADSGLVQLYQQLQQNAETFRLLSLVHPYVYATQRQFVTTLHDSVIDRPPLEELAGTSARSWSYEAGKLVFAGKVGTGFTLRSGRELAQRLARMARADSPFEAVPREYRRGVNWVEPCLVAEVEFSTWTADKILRHR